MGHFEIQYQKNNKLHSIILEDIDDTNLLPKNIISINKIENKKTRNFYIFKQNDLNSFFYELDTMLQANLTINEAIKILKNNTYDKQTKVLIQSIDSSLSNGQYIYKNIKQYESFLGKLIIEFIKIGEENGNIKQAINSIVKIQKQSLRNKKRIIKSFTYPSILLISLLLSISSLFTFVIPRFEVLYSGYKEELPLSTQYMLLLKELFDSYFLVFTFILVFIVLLLSYLYKKSDKFKEKLDRFLVTKVPFISKLFLISNSSNFFFSLSTLLKDKHRFFDALSNSKSLVSNRYVYYKISKIEKAIKDGRSISEAFEDSKLFDDLTIRLINTGEKSNNLTLTLSKINKIYKEKLDNALRNFITVFEPSIIAIMAAIILWLVIAIFTPIWDMSTILR